MWSSMSAEERCAVFKRMYCDEGKPTTAIAAELGASRSAICSHMSRYREAMGLPPADRKSGGRRTAIVRWANVERAPKPKREKKAKAKRPVFQFGTGAEIEGVDYSWKRAENWMPLEGTTPVALVDLSSRQCRWPVGEGPFVFCGCSAVEGRPYCTAHNTLARAR